MWILKFYWLLPFTNETFHVSKPSTLHPAYKTIGFGLGKEHSPSILWRSDREPLTFINNKQLIFCTSVLHYTQIIHQKSPNKAHFYIFPQVKKVKFKTAMLCSCLCCLKIGYPMEAPNPHEMRAASRLCGCDGSSQLFRRFDVVMPLLWWDQYSNPNSAIACHCLNDWWFPELDDEGNVCVPMFLLVEKVETMII